ncbi:hypothetical protein VTN00DRAFT_4488 [Thermoascus crustaceus]|uniref:uncharacterized protein n=1 Tax=Thermoascus crustaceus TaxID=5088 RepID=UPI003742F843
MAEEEKFGMKASTGVTSPNPESPTTARPLDFDDEPQETGVTSAPSPSAPAQPAQPTDAAEAAPPKPPRPLSPRQQAENTLKEAFPTVDAAVVKAVLVASDGNLERAFHALLGMTDPSAQEEIPPVKPPRPSQAPTSTTQRQLEADEMYARQLAEHYNGPRRRGPPSDYNGYGYPRQRRESDLYDEEEREHSFFDDDLPIIRENIRKGFLETQSKVNAWVQNLKKKLDGEEDEPQHTEGYTRGYGEGQNYNRPRRSGDFGRRSGDRERYDADPQLLSDDFSALELKDSEAPPPRPARPLANPDLFKKSSPSPDRRKVSFQEGPPEEITNRFDPPESTKRTPSTGSRNSKWQPLSTVEPSPVGENDPFSLGDSEDERDTKNKDPSADEAERVKKATADAMAGEIGSGPKDNSKADNTAGK